MRLLLIRSPSKNGIPTLRKVQQFNEAPLQTGHPPVPYTSSQDGLEVKSAISPPIALAAITDEPPTGLGLDYVRPIKGHNGPHPYVIQRVYVNNGNQTKAKELSGFK